MISGGGIGGLTLAVALSKYEHIEVVLYEGATSFREVGVGFGVWPRERNLQFTSYTNQPVFKGAWKVLVKLGLEEELLKIAEGAPTEELGALAFLSLILVVAKVPFSAFF